MSPHTRALVAAATFAFVTGKKVAGLYDHAAGRDLRIAAEARDNRLQAIDGERSVKFGGTLPELYDAGDKTHVSFEWEDARAQGFDRATSTHFTANVAGGVVQVFDHGQNAWFAYDVQDGDAAHSYHRAADAGA